MSRQSVRLLYLTVALGLVLAGCGGEGGDDSAPRAASSTPSVQASGASLLTARGRLEVDGAALEAVTSADEPLPLGAALRPHDPTETVIVTARNDAASPTLVAVVGRTAPQAATDLAVHAWVDGQPVDDQVDIAPATDGTAQEGGVALVLAAGQTATVAIAGAQEGVALVTDAASPALFETLTPDLPTLQEPHTRLTVPSWLRLWVLKQVTKGLTCLGIEAVLKGQGMVCLDKPWWVPNPLCLWQAVFCGYPAQ